MARKRKIPSRERFIEVCKLCKTKTELAREIGVKSTRTVTLYAEELNVNLEEYDIFPYGTKKPSKEQFIKICKNSRMRVEIARKLGTSERSVDRLAEKFDLNLSDLLKKSEEPYILLQRELLEERYKNSNIPVKDLAQEFNVSEYMIYQNLDYYIIPRRQERKSDSLELKNKVIRTFIQEHVVDAVVNKLHMDNRRINEILTQHGFKIPNNSEARIRNHLNGDRWAPLPEKLLNIIDGEMLGDGNIRYDSVYTPPTQNYT
ncbi:MAG: hypothetical protein ACFFC7_07765 [Candidatus Hermodarchaeota archaeon]